MKKLSYFISMLAMMLVASCSSDTEDFIAEGNNGKTITVNVSNPEGTRVNTEDLLNMTWEEGDVLYVLDENYGNEGLELKSFNGGNAVFSAPTVTGNELTFYYSGIGQNAFFYSNIYYTDQIQNGFNSKHVKDRIALYSDIVSPENLSKVQLNIKNSVLRINVKNMPQFLQDATSSTVKCYLGETDPAATLTLNAQMVAGQDNFIYMVFNPGILYSGSEISVEFAVGSETARAKALVTTGKEYLPGRIYTMVIDNESTKEHRALTWEKPAGGGDQGGDVVVAGDMKIKWAEGAAVPESLGGGQITKNADADAEGFVSYTVTGSSWSPNLKSIPEGAFMNNTDIVEVVLPEDLISVGVQAFFGCTNLQSVVIPEGSTLAEILSSAFEGCAKLTSINLPEGLSTIEGGAFACTGLTSLVIPSTVTTIGNCMLRECKNMTDLTIKHPYLDGAHYKYAKLWDYGWFSPVSNPAGCAIHLDSSWKDKTFTRKGTTYSYVNGNNFCEVAYTSLDFIN